MKKNTLVKLDFAHIPSSYGILCVGTEKRSQTSEPSRLALSLLFFPSGKLLKCSHKNTE